MNDTIDLHFDTLIQKAHTPIYHKFMSAHEKLVFQLQELRKFYYNAVQLQAHRIKIIHGTGNGKLKQEIQKFLHDRTEVQQVREALLNEGGEGVSIVYFKL